MKHSIKCYTQRVYADQITPIAAYLNVRGNYACSFLLESSEIDDQQQARSIICAQPIAGFQVKNSMIHQSVLQQVVSNRIDESTCVPGELKWFIEGFIPSSSQEGINGFFGYQSFESVRYFESRKADLCPQSQPDIPEMDYRLFRFVLCFNHFNNEMVFIENVLGDEVSELESFIDIVINQRSATHAFHADEDEFCLDSDEDFLKKVGIAQTHCQRGNVFQMVLSRKFSKSYRGDEFNVYRALRHVNPSPYMFYFDYGGFKIFGSSPEAQIRISAHEVFINPIAGTYRRTGDKQKDQLLAERLLNDQKELAEHAMLVDLARNDLNRSCANVGVTEFKTIKFFSHVIHMVSTVRGDLTEEYSSLDALASTFPAGTLSGAPKVRAIQLLAEIEGTPRGIYGGSIGFIEFNGNINQAIIIRSFLAKNNCLFYQAGAGVVLKSMPENELQEVNNKLAALRKAIIEAEKI